MNVKSPLDCARGDPELVEGSRLARCAMLDVEPVRRLSIPMTEYPRSRSVSERCEPMNPAAPVMTTLGIRSVGVFLESAQHGQPHDLEVETDGPVFDVIQVVFDALLQRGVAAPAVDLRPAGDARFDLVAKHVLGNPVLELLDEIGTFGPGPDDRHIAAK